MKIFSENIPEHIFWSVNRDTKLGEWRDKITGELIARELNHEEEFIELLKRKKFKSYCKSCRSILKDES